MYSQQVHELEYRTSCISEEKYKVARLIQASSTFSVVSILEGSDQPCMYDAMYAVIGELLDKGLIEDTQQYDISNDNQLVKIYRVVHKLDENGVYQVDLEKQSVFESYIERLDNARTQPDNQGKPRSLNFRIAEKVINELRNLPIGQISENRELLLLSFYRHLSLAQLEETTEESSPQNSVSEAYIRQLYAEYLIAQDSQQWSTAIAQLIKAAQLFKEKGLADLQRVCDSRSCEILINHYNSLCMTSFKESITKLLDFAREIDVLVKAVSNKCSSINFQFLYKRILDEVQYKIDFLNRSTGELSQVTSRGWTISARCETPIVSDIYNLLNQARLLLINSGHSQERKLDAKDRLEEAQILLESRWQGINLEDATMLKHLLKSHLQSLNISLSLSELNGLKLQHNTAILNNLNFEGVLPFYWADTLRQLITKVAEGISRSTFASEVEQGIVENSFSSSSELLTPEPELEDIGYTLNDFEDLRSAIENESSYEWDMKEGSRINDSKNYQDIRINAPTRLEESENPSTMESDLFVSGLTNYQLRSTLHSPLLDEELLDARKSHKTYSTPYYPSRTLSVALGQNHVNKLEFDLRLLSLPAAKQVLLSK